MKIKKKKKKNSARSLIIFPCPVCVSQECPVGLLILWRTACFRGWTFMPAALWSISVTPAFTCWETPKCTVPTVESGVEIHQLVSVRHKRTLFSSVIQRKEKLTCKKKTSCVHFVFVCVQMWMSVLWDLTVMNTLVVRTQRAPTPAHVPTRTVETARTAQVMKIYEML